MMNQLIRENNPKLNTILVTSGSIVAVIGTYFLIKHRNHIYELIKSFRQDQLDKLQRTQIKNSSKKETNTKTNSNASKISQMINSIETQIKQTSHERARNDLKEFHLETNKPLLEKRKTMEDWWKNPKNAKSTYLSHLKVDEVEELEPGEKLEEAINYKELSFESLIEKFENGSLNRKFEIVNTLNNKCETKHLAQLFVMLNKSFSEKSNLDLFAKYTFINTTGDVYTEMLVKLLTLIETLTAKSDDPNLKDLFQSYESVVNILFSYVFNLEKNKNNAKRKSKVEKIKYLSLNIFSNMINYINVNHGLYDSNDQKFLEKILSREDNFTHLDSTRSVFSSQNKVLNSTVYLILMANITRACVNFEFNKENFNANTLYSYLNSETVIENLKEYERELRYKEHLEEVYTQLTLLRNKLKSEDTNSKQDEENQILDIKCEIKQEANEIEVMCYATQS